MGVVNVPADQEEVGEPLGALLPLVAQRDGGVIADIVPEGNCDLIFLSIYLSILSICHQVTLLKDTLHYTSA